MRRCCKVAGVVRFCCLMFLPVLILPAVNAAERRAKSSSEKFIPPTLASDSRGSVDRGGTTVIQLQAVPAYGSAIRFEITDPPTQGRILQVKATSDHTAEVTYQHDGGSDSENDLFRFRCQSPGHAKSSTHTVDIKVIPPPARLSCDPGSLDFGDVFLSEKKRKTLVLKNYGGKRAVGRLLLSGAFSAPEGDSFDLAEGESVSMVIEFNPMDEGKVSFAASCQPSAGLEPIALSGKGVCRYEVSDTGEYERMVINRCQQPLRLSCTHEGSDDGGWILPEVMDLPPGASKKMTFRHAELAEGNDPPGDKGVLLSDGLTTKRMLLPPPPRFVPLIVRSLSDRQLGMLTLGSSIPVRFWIQNRSDGVRSVSFKASSASGGTAPLSVVNLAAGESREIRFDWKPSLPGEAVLNISVQEGKRVSHRLEWCVSVINSSETLMPGGRSDSMPYQETISQSRQSSPAIVANPLTTNALPPPPSVQGIATAIRSSWSGKKEVFLSWDAEPAESSRITLEEKRVILAHPQASGTMPKASPLDGTTPFTLDFLNLDTSYLAQVGNRWEIPLRDLAPGWHTLVLSKLSAIGGVQASSELHVHIPQKRGGTTLKWFYGILATAAVVFFWKLRSKAKG